MTLVTGRALTAGDIKDRVFDLTRRGNPHYMISSTASATQSDDSDTYDLSDAHSAGGDGAVCGGMGVGGRDTEQPHQVEAVASRISSTRPSHSTSESPPLVIHR